MIVEETFLKGCLIIKPKVFTDDRGYFFESFNLKKFKDETGVSVNFIQDNQSKSSAGVLRGLHFQKAPYSQAKLVRVIQGKVLDVVVDLRKNSPTFGKHFKIVLDAQEHTQLFIPRDFAHGFLVLSDTVIFSYKCDNFYHKDSEQGIIYNDPDLNIDWGLPAEKLLLSDKDLRLPRLKDIF